MKLSREIEKNKAYFSDNLPIGKSFDTIGREIRVGQRLGYLVFIDGFAKDDMMYHIIHALQDIEYDLNIENYIPNLIRSKIAYLEATPCGDFEKMQDAVLSGALALVIDGEDTGIIIDAREYPARSPEESDTEKITMGAKDGFVETIVFNTALIRRRVRDNNLTFEMMTVGSRSKTDVCLGYIKGLADEAYVNSLKDKISQIQVESLVMAEKSLEELLIKKRWYNPLPQAKYTQRPDITASFLYEGHVAILVDTSPNVMITPATVFYFTQYAEDYYQIPIVGTYNRMIRFLAILVSLFLTPTWLLLAENADKLPELISFIGVEDAGTFSLLFQFLILEFGFDLLKMSSLHTPNYLGGAFGIIGGLLLGEFAIEVGFFVSETIFYMALTAVASYCIPNYEFTAATRLFRLVLLIAAGLFGVWGYSIALILIIVIFMTTETLDPKRPYLWPLIPLDIKALGNFLIRKEVTNKKGL